MELTSTKSFLNENGDRFKLGLTISAIETAHKDQQSGLVIGQCKALIESLCKSIHDIYQKQYDTSATFQSLAKGAIKMLELGKGSEAETKTKEAYTKLINSFINMVDNATTSIGTLRNEYCPLAHGRGLNHKPLHMSYANYIFSQTDALVSFILLLIDEKDNLEPPARFEDNLDFNTHINDTYDSVEIFGDLYLPAEIIYNLNPEKYKVALAEFKEAEPDL